MTMTQTEQTNAYRFELKEDIMNCEPCEPCERFRPTYNTKER